MQAASYTTRRATLVLAASIVATQLAWGNFTWTRLAKYQFFYDDVALPRLVVAALGVALTWIVLSLGPLRRRVSVHPSWIAAVALAVAAFASGVLSKQSLDVWLGQSERLEGVFTIALYALLLGAGLQVGRSDNNLRILAYAVTTSSTILALYGISQALGLDPANHELAGYGFPLTHAFASLGNPNFLAGALVLSAPVAAGLALEAPGGSSRRRAVLAAAALAQLAALVLARSEGAYVASVVVASIVVGRFSHARARDRGMPAPRAKLIAAVSGAGVLAVAGAALATVAGVSSHYATLISASAKGRAGLVLGALEAMRARPLTGYGPDAFMAALRMHRPDLYVDTVGRTLIQNNAHSWVFQYFATLGIAGGLLLVLTLILGLWGARPPASRDRASAATLRFAAWLGLLGYVVHMQANVAVIAATVPFWILLGALAAPRATQRELPGRTRLVVLAASSLALVVFAVFGVRLLAADHHFLNSRFMYHRLMPGDAVAEARKARQLNPMSVKYARGEAQILIRETLTAAIQPGADKAELRRMWKRTDQALRRSFDRSPHDYPTMAWYAGFNAEMSQRLGDDQLAQNAGIMALIAARNDRYGVEVYRLAEREFTTQTVDAALATTPLP